MNRRAYLIVSAHPDAIPTSLPTWLLPIVDGLAAAREARFHVEQAVSVIARLPDGATTAERCAKVVGEFVREYGEKVEAHAKVFAHRRGDLPPDLAHAIGVELAEVLITLANLTYRANVMQTLARSWPQFGDDKGATAAALLGCVVEASPGQSVALDWIGTHLLSAPVVQTEHQA